MQGVADDADVRTDPRLAADVSPTTQDAYVTVCGGWACPASSHRRSTASDRANSITLMITTQVKERIAAKNPTIGTSPSTPSTTAAQARNRAKKRRPRSRATPLANRKV